jgi:hypothetical protein
MKILPGLSKVRGEWNLVCLAIDLRPRPGGARFSALLAAQ